MKHRYKIIIEYLGTGLVGWQRQASGVSVQQIIEEAIYKFSQEKVQVFAAGRTDAGVHAIGQVAHFDLSRYYVVDKIIASLNHFMRPYLVGIVDCQEVDSSFHARFSAKSRAYLYKIVNRRSGVIIDAGRAWWIKKPLNVEKMRQATEYFVGYHDFTSFRAKNCQAKSPLRTLSAIDILQEQELISLHFSAPSFLHHMVRNIVGSLVMVGFNKCQPEYIKVILDGKNREMAGATAPAAGLYFLKVEY